jgi:DNA-binding NarL/FixJ family response regulator
MLIRVAIVEDSAPVRETWARLISASAGLRCVGVCATGDEALVRIPEWKPDVVLMDINMPGLSGIECASRLKTRLPGTQILMVTVYGDSERVFQALQAGASGYLLKRTSPDELVAAIKDVVAGGAPMTSEVARKVIETFRHPTPAGLSEASLSERESEVLALVAKGYSNKEIADHLAIGFETVRTHLKNIYEKLHVRSRTEAAARYLRATESNPAG